MSDGRPPILLVATPGGRVRALVETAAARHAGTVLEPVDGEPPAERLEIAGSVWIEAARPDAAAVLRAVRAARPEIPCVYLLPREGREELERRLRLGAPSTPCLALAEDELPGALADVLEQIERDRRLHGTLDGINRRLAVRPPPAEEQRRLLRSETYLALLLSHLPDAVASADRSGRILTWNDAATEIFGHRPGEIAGRPALELVDPDETPRLRRLLARAADGESSRGERICCRHRDGRRFTAEWTVVPLRDEQGETRGLVIIARDIAEHLRLEEAERFLQNLSRALLAEALHDLGTLERVAELSVPVLADWCVIDVWEEGRGLQRVASSHADPELAAVVRELQERFPTRPDSSAPGAEAFRSGSSVLLRRIDQRTLRARSSGEEHRALLDHLGVRSLIAVPLVARGRILGAVTFVRGHSGRHFEESDLLLAHDVAQRTALAVSNARLYAEAQSALEAREELTAIVSHDLRNPLSTAGVSAELLKQDLPPEKRHRQAQVLERSLRRMGGLLDDLLDLSRLETGRLAVEREPVDLGPLLLEACEDHQGLAAEKRSEIRCSPDPDLPAVFGDRPRLLQVLANLLGNAIKFSPEGEPVEVEAQPVNGEVCVSVRDRGPGLSREEQGRVFDRFWQAREGDRRGVGLGLAISRGLVEAHGGRIWIESEPGQGATFRFTVPTAKTG